MVAAEKDKLQDEVRLTKMQHEDDLCVPIQHDALMEFVQWTSSSILQEPASIGLD
jgi:hypothetical protein